MDLTDDLPVIAWYAAAMKVLKLVLRLADSQGELVCRDYSRRYDRGRFGMFTRKAWVIALWPLPEDWHTTRI